MVLLSLFRFVNGGRECKLRKTRPPLFISCATLSLSLSLFLSLLLSLALVLPLLLFLLWPAPVMAQTRASRPPLDIIPKSKISITAKNLQAEEETRPAVLPALKPGRVKPARPVRAVASLGGGKGVVQVGVLDNLEHTEIGLYEGYGSHLWLNSRLSTVSRLMRQLSPHYASPIASHIAISLMASRAAPPPGLSKEESFFALRLNYLLTLGESGAVRELAALTGAEQRDAFIARIVAQAALVQNDMAGACAMLGLFAQYDGAALRKAEAEFVLQLRALCQLEAGDVASAALTLNLARESGFKDRLFLDGLFAITADTEWQRVAPVAGHRLSIMQAVLLYRAGAVLFPQEVAGLHPDLLAPFIKAGKQTHEVTLLLAARAVQLNKIELSYLRALMALTELPLIPPPASSGIISNAPPDTPSNTQPNTLSNAPSSNASSSNASPNAPLDAIERIVAQAQQIKIIDELVTPRGKISALQDFLRYAVAQGDWALMVALTGAHIASIEPDAAYADFALYAVPALLQLGERERARLWHNVLLEQQNGLPSARSRHLQSLLRLHDLDERETLDEKNAKTLDKKNEQARQEQQAQQIQQTQQAQQTKQVPPMEAILMGAVLETGGAQEISYMKAEIELLPLFGFALPDYLREAAHKPSDDRLLNSALKDMEQAVKNNERGVALLYGLSALARLEAQKEMNVTALARVLAAWQALGLAKPAREMAQNWLIRQAAHLVIAG